MAYKGSHVYLWIIRSEQIRTACPRRLFSQMGLPRLLITGSKGKIGTVLIEALADSFEVYGVDILDTVGQRTFRADIADYE